MAYLPNFFASSIDSGSTFPLVSGRKREKTPATIDRPPKMIRGRAVPNGPSTSLPCNVSKKIAWCICEQLKRKSARGSVPFN